jgi:hypothetical protein
MRMQIVFGIGGKFPLAPAAAEVVVIVPVDVVVFARRGDGHATDWIGQLCSRATPVVTAAVLTSRVCHMFVITHGSPWVCACCIGEQYCPEISSMPVMDGQYLIILVQRDCNA